MLIKLIRFQLRVEPTQLSEAINEVSSIPTSKLPSIFAPSCTLAGPRPTSEPSRVFPVCSGTSPNLSSSLASSDLCPLLLLTRPPGKQLPTASHQGCPPPFPRCRAAQSQVRLELGTEVQGFVPSPELSCSFSRRPGGDSARAQRLTTSHRSSSTGL